MTVSKHFRVSVRRVGEWATPDMDFRTVQQQNNSRFSFPKLDNLLIRDLQKFLLHIHHLHKYFLLCHNRQFHKLIQFHLKRNSGFGKHPGLWSRVLDFIPRIWRYEMDLKMAQKGCDRDRLRDKICTQISKWSNYIFSFEMRHF